jgi:hypothetical protein
MYCVKPEMALKLNENKYIGKGNKFAPLPLKFGAQNIYDSAREITEVSMRAEDAEATTLNDSNSEVVGNFW